MSKRTECAAAIVAGIIDDMNGRSGGDGWWDGIAADTQGEIRDAWVEIVVNTSADFDDLYDGDDGDVK